MLIRGSERILSKLSSVKCFKGTHLQVMPDRHMHEDGKKHVGHVGLLMVDLMGGREVMEEERGEGKIRREKFGK